MEFDPNIEEFCDYCGTLINIQPQGEVKCPLCRKVFDITKISHFERTINLSKNEEVDLGSSTGSIRPIINERCPQCSHEGLYFSTAQLRSADEGQTIFYECPECGYKYQQNS